jgi:hypothetical protein
MKKLFSICMTTLILFWSFSFSYGEGCQICSDSPLPNWGYCYQISICEQFCYIQSEGAGANTCDGVTDYGMLCPPEC